MYGRAIVGLGVFAALQALGDVVLWNWLESGWTADPFVPGYAWLAWTALQFVLAALVGVIASRAGIAMVRSDAERSLSSKIDPEVIGPEHGHMATA